MQNNLLVIHEQFLIYLQDTGFHEIQRTELISHLIESGFAKPAVEQYITYLTTEGYFCFPTGDQETLQLVTKLPGQEEESFVTTTGRRVKLTNGITLDYYRHCIDLNCPHCDEFQTVGFKMIWEGDAGYQGQIAIRCYRCQRYIPLKLNYSDNDKVLYRPIINARFRKRKKPSEN